VSVVFGFDGFGVVVFVVYGRCGVMDELSEISGDMVGDMVGDMELFDLWVMVDCIEGCLVCGMVVGDYFELVNSVELWLFEGKYFCVYVL